MAKTKRLARSSAQPKVVSLAVEKPKKPAQQKAYYKHDLPFVATDKDGKPVDLWAVTATGTGSSRGDFRMGYRFAFEYLSWRRRGHDHPDLSRVLSEVNKDTGYIALGFEMAIEQAAIWGLTSLHARLDDLDVEARQREIEAVQRKKINLHGANG